MLTFLRVRQLAIIEELEVEFGPGLNVVTGETGAGKSILVNAMKLVLGERGRPDLIRTGAEKMEIEALFDLTESPGARARLAELEIEAGDELLIRRTVDVSGRSRAYLNGRLSTLGQLGAVARGLVDICSQHEHHALVDASCHIGYLDAFAGIEAESRKMAEVYQRLQKAEAELVAVQRVIRERAERENLLSFQLSELDELDPQPGEEVRLAEDVERTRHAAELSSGTREADLELFSSDASIHARLRRIIALLGGLCRFDPELEVPMMQLEAARGELKTAAQQIRRYADRIKVDPNRLHQMEERLSDLRRALRKYGGSMEELLAHREAMQEELDRLSLVDGERERLVAVQRQVSGEASALAEAISEQRRRHAVELGATITSELRTLGMGEARVEVEVARPEGGHLGPTGLDRVEFLIATNRGEEPRPLRKVASGGELSRALLALKQTLAGLGPASLYVFDEVDSGVGGAIAEVIAQKLREVARHSQVLCITHLPQIAAYGNQHFHVRKGVVEGRTRSVICRLTEEERLEEVARMLGGIRVSDLTKLAAAEMLRVSRT